MVCLTEEEVVCTCSVVQSGFVVSSFEPSSVVSLCSTVVTILLVDGFVSILLVDICSSVVMPSSARVV